MDLKGAKSSCLALFAGATQSSVLGPIFFIPHVNDLYLCVEPDMCEVLLYADDLFLLFNAYCTSNVNLERSVGDCLECVSPLTLGNRRMLCRD